MEARLSPGEEGGRAGKALIALTHSRERDVSLVWELLFRGLYDAEPRQGRKGEALGRDRNTT